MELEILFNLVKNKCYKLIKKNKKFDGRAFWQPIKNELSKLDIKATKWKKISKSLTNKVMKQPEYIKDGYGKEHIIENHHFIIQQVRIPLQEKPSLRKIIQIALNIGQWKGDNDKKIMKEIDYKNSGLDNINKYISKSDIRKISSKIPKSTMDRIIKYLNKI